MKKYLFKIFIILLTVFIVTIPTTTAYASSWTPGNESEIYSGQGSNSVTQQPSAEEKPGFFEKGLISLVNAVANGLSSLLNNMGLSIDTVVYGRVGGNSTNGIALYTFELKSGNPYGIVGAKIYVFFRAVCYIAITVAVFAKLSIGMFSPATSQKILKLKTDFSSLLLLFLLLSLMPHLLDAGLYIRDIFLYMVKNIGNINFNQSTIIDVFKSGADKSIINSMLYLASVCFGLYLGFLYIGYAMSFLISFAMFPIIATFAVFKRELLSTWISQIAYFAMIPVMDATLLLVPAFISRLNIGINTGLITLLSCMTIVSSRSFMSRLLGLNSGGSDLLGFAAIMSIGKLAGSAVHTAKNTIGRVKAASSDFKRAKYESEMATVEDSEASAMQMPSNSSMANGTHNDRTEIADKYANINNVDDPYNSRNISHTKKAELYKKRAFKNVFAAGGSMAGGIIGGNLGMGAGLFTGPVGTSLMAAGGTSLGSAVGDNVGFAVGGHKIIRNSGSRIASSSSSGGGNDSSFSNSNIDSSDVSLTPTIYSAGVVEPYTETIYSAGIVEPYTESSETFYNNCKNVAMANKTAIKDSMCVTSADYITNSKELIKPFHDDICRKYKLSKQDKSKIDKNTQQDYRNEFRAKVREQYLRDFDKNFTTNPSAQLSHDAEVNAAIKAYTHKALDETILNKDWANSIYSDQVLNNYDWMNF